MKKRFDADSDVSTRSFAKFAARLRSRGK